MKRYQKLMLAMTGIVLFSYSGLTGFAAAGQEKGPGVVIDPEDKTGDKEEQELMGRIAAASETDSLILVVGQEGEKVELSYHTKGEDNLWKEEFSIAGRYGKNGATGEKREGDKKTPLGTYRFTMAFGVKENPGSVLPYHELTATDYWVDDPDSRYYNRLVDSKTVKKDWKSAEHMASIVPFYHYGLALNYNSECVPGLGSAIFLHCMNGAADTGTSGCVKIPEEYMKLLVQNVDEETRIVIVSDISQLGQMEE